MNTNLRGVYYCIRSFAPLMIRARSGHIINISSLAGKNALPNGARTRPSKWGLNGLTYSVAEELRVHNIRVSVIARDRVHTDFTPHTGKDQGKNAATGRCRSHSGDDRDQARSRSPAKILLSANAEPIRGI